MAIDYALLSFLKNKNIDYIYIPDEKQVKIPCIKCENETLMCVVTTNWQCNNCHSKGNLLTLINWSKEKAIQTKLYNLN